jgi:hypothetical protein
MRDVLLSSPLVVGYVLYIAALLVVIFWSGRPNSPERGGSAHRSGMRGNGDRNYPARRFIWAQAGRMLLPVQELKASCSAEYSALFATAIKRIRNE